MTTSSASNGGRDLPLGNLRVCLTLLVVAHHAMLAYHPYAPPPPSSLSTAPLISLAFPVVDSVRSPVVALLVGFNDTFFMSLMFLVSGVFAWPSLQRKGGATFFRDRLLRLGMPFLVAAAILAPLAYYPTYLQAGGDSGHGSFPTQWLALGAWPAGPAWFLWVLLLFGGVAAMLSRLWPKWGEVLGAQVSRVADRPVVAFLALAALSAAAYLPMAAVFGPLDWAHVGPFFIQTSRALHYLVYFLIGAGVGAAGLGRGLLAADGKLARRWPLWVLASLVAFAFAIAMVVAVMSGMAKGAPSTGVLTLGNLSFVLSCAASSFAFLALFVRFGRWSGAASASLAANAYGIYLLHYFCVSWLQLGLLQAQLPALVKAVLVFLGAVAVSWGLTAGLRRIPAVARVV